MIPLITLFLLAFLAPSLALGGNRFGLILPSAITILILFARRAPHIGPPRYASWLWLAVMSWGGVQIALGLTPDSGEAARTLGRYALCATVFLIAADIASRPLLDGVLVKATAGWIALSCIYGLIASSVGANPVLAELKVYASPLEATFVNRNAFSLYSVFGLLASLCAVARQGQGNRTTIRDGWVWLAAALICGVAFVLTASRGGLGAGVLGVIIFGLIIGRGKLSAALASLIGTTALISAGLIGDAYLREASIFGDPRFALHAQVFAETTKAPLLGHGLGAFQDAFRMSLGAEWRWGDWDHAHQQYLETAFEVGWPAAIALFAAIVLSAPRPLSGDPITALTLAALGAAAAHAMVDLSLTIPSVAMTLALFLGVASGRQRRAS